MKKFLDNLAWIGMLLLLAGLVDYSMESMWTLTAKILTIAGAAIFLGGAALNYRTMMAGLQKRTTLLGAQSILSVLIVLGILGGINFLGQRHAKRWDLTAQGQFSLASQTVNTLKNLKTPITLKAFFEGGEYPPLRDLLVEFRSISPQINYEFIDPNKKPQVAKQYGVRVYGTFSNPFTGTSAKYGTVILESGKKTEKIEKQQDPVKEEDLTNALIKVTRDVTKTAYFLDGHEEKGPDGQDETGYGQAKAQMEKENFVVKTLNLVRENAVPADCTLLIIAGAQKALFPQELTLIKNYLDKGGSMLLLLDPEPSPGFEDLMKDRGVDVGKNVVVDVSGVGRLFGTGPEIPLVTSYPSHRITDKFRAMTFFPLTRSVMPASSVPTGFRVEKLLETNPQSWAETGDLKGEIQFDQGKDIQGPVSIGVAVTKEKSGAVDSAGKEKSSGKEGRMVVVGDSDFACNRFFRQQGNGNLFLNMCNWLAADEDLISIRPKDPQDKRVVLSGYQSKLLYYISVVFLPVLILVAGTVVWLRRKRL